MKIVVDANIIFSGILNVDGKIGDLLINSVKYFQFIAPHFLRKEIFKHYTKLGKISGFIPLQIREAEIQICKDITFISEEQVNIGAWAIAETLVADVDPKDIHYIAYANHFDCKLWSGDKQLIRGLTKKGFTGIITTNELFELRQNMFAN